MTAKIFTIEEANALVPELTTRVGELLERADTIESRLEALRARAGKASVSASPDGEVLLEPSPSDEPTLRDEKLGILEAIDAFETGWHEVEALGAVVKDTRSGLLDFYGHVAGKLVWLCWRHGEESVAHYHDLDTGFSSRKPIDTALRRSLLN